MCSASKGGYGTSKMPPTRSLWNAPLFLTIFVFRREKMVGAMSAPVQICLVRVHSPYFALAFRTWSTADLPGPMTDFSVSDLYYIKQVIVYAVSARSNDALWSTWEG